jgi:hypothetical protein
VLHTIVRRSQEFDYQLRVLMDDLGRQVRKESHSFKNIQKQ